MLCVVAFMVFGHFHTSGVTAHDIPVEIHSIPDWSFDFQENLRVARVLGHRYTRSIGTHKIYSSASTWNEARLICKEVKGHLAVINSVNESRAVAQLLITASLPQNQFKSVQSAKAFIGFHDFYRDGLYTTIHDESLAQAGYDEWFENGTDIADGDQHCGAIGTTGKLHMVGCNIPHAFICEWPDHKESGCIVEKYSTIPGSSTTESEADTESTTSVSTTDTTESTTVEEGCEITEFGCCPDSETPATGKNFEGCGVIDAENCTASHYGCCPDGVDAALGPDNEGCRMACENGTFGCCDDGSTPAHGPNKEGCCLTSTYKCCPDNIREALGPDFYGCGCQYAAYGCCPDNSTTARGPNNEGCGCEHAPHGCCPNRVTAATEPNFEGCPCHTHQFGCCPDGIFIARGPQNQDVCTLPKVAVPCGTTGEQYYYDVRSDSCVEFEYGRCSGNKNDFGDKKSCEDRCRKSTDVPTTTLPPTTTTTTTIAPITRLPDTRPLSPICSAPRDPGSCNNDETAYYYDTEKKTCNAFMYGGCDGNANRFQTEEQCERLCGSFQGQDVCNAQADPGPCLAAFTKYYFDPITRSCRQFTYGGCDGNANRFSSEDECEAVCVHREEPKPPGNTTNEAICMDPVDVGNCAPRKYWRYYYNDERLECLAFIYTGCGGNLNRFKSYSSCKNTCIVPALNRIDAGPPGPGSKNPCQIAQAECDAIHCEFGKEEYVDENDCTRCRCVNPCATKICPEGTRCAVDLVPRGEPLTVCRRILKPGNCPRLSNSTTCQMECSSDADCTGDFKCCSVGCGSSCLEPAPTEPVVTPPPTYDPARYPGAVPAVIESPAEENLKAQEGGYIIMKCVATGNPRPVITWRKGVTLINNSASRYSVTVEGSLQIVDLYRTDAGIFTCTADNHVAAPVKVRYELEITAPSDHVPVIIGERDHRVTVSLNSPAVLQCQAWGWPRPVISWWHKGYLLPMATKQYKYQRDYSLRIQRVALPNLGVYTCQAFNGVGTSTSWSVTLQAPGPVYDVNPELQKYLQYLVEPQRRPTPPDVRPPPPYIPPIIAPPAPEPPTYAPYYPDENPRVPPVLNDTEPSPEIILNKYTAPVKVNVSVVSGPFPIRSEFTIACDVEGFPIPRVIWFKDDNPIQPDNRIRISEANRLVISNAERSDTGRYRCEAANQYTRDEKSVDITVDGIYIPSYCQDTAYFVNCALIVKGKFCNHDYYVRFCCRSCTEAGELLPRQPHINDTRRKRRSALPFL